MADLHLRAEVGAQPGVEPLEQARYAIREGGAVGRDVDAQPRRQDQRIRRHVDEGKPPAQRLVDRGRRAVGGVHGAEEIEVGRQAEAATRVRQADRLIAVLQQVEQFAEDARQVAAVDLVDDQDVRFRRPTGRLRGEGTQQPVLDGVGDFVPAAHLHGSDLYALDKLLIGVGRVELHQPHRLVAAAGQQPGQAAGDVCLAGAGDALQDELPFQIEQAARPPQPVVGQEGVAAEVGVGEAAARRDAGPARQKRHGIVLDGAGESR